MYVYRITKQQCGSCALHLPTTVLFSSLLLKLFAFVHAKPVRFSYDVVYWLIVLW